MTPKERARAMLHRVKVFLFPPEPKCPYGVRHVPVLLYSVPIAFSQPTIYWCRRCGSIAESELPTSTPNFTRHPEYYLLRVPGAYTPVKWKE